MSIRSLVLSLLLAAPRTISAVSLELNGKGGIARVVRSEPARTKEPHPILAKDPQLAVQEEFKRRVKHGYFLEQAQSFSEDSSASSSTYGLGGSSMAVSWPEGHMQVSKLHGHPHAQVLDRPLDTKSFVKWMKRAPWEGASENASDFAVKSLMEELLDYVEQDHPMKVKRCDSGSMIQAQSLTSKDCSEVLGGFNDHALSMEKDFVAEQAGHRQHKDVQGNRIFKGLRPENNSAFLVDINIFGFDLDTLEIRLHELRDVVDLFALIEMPVTHRGHSKPLLWSRNKDKPRFAAFKQRVLHVVVDDNDVWHHLRSGMRSPGNISVLAGQEGRGLAKLQQMMQSMLAGPRDSGRAVVMSYGHVDEIPAPRNLALLKRCQPNELPIDSGAWMPMGRFDRAVRAAWPVGVLGELPYTYGSPTFQEFPKSMQRGLGSSKRYLLGGWHLNAYTYPPHVLMRFLACAECKGIPDEVLKMLRRDKMGLREFYEGLTTLAFDVESSKRALPIAKLRKSYPYSEHPDLLRPPRIVECNPQRFEVWFGHFDRRLRLQP
mmetsp:Transcript_148718/g.257539  ORF Transcript_148718/g.257539 Transcript_148718/m.257539 type:complete len:546 (+) Transcript_148718:28-1665(+)